MKAKILLLILDFILYMVGVWGSDVLTSKCSGVHLSFKRDFESSNLLGNDFFVLVDFDPFGKQYFTVYIHLIETIFGLFQRNKKVVNGMLGICYRLFFWCQKLPHFCVFKAGIKSVFRNLLNLPEPIEGRRIWEK